MPRPNPPPPLPPLAVAPFVLDDHAKHDLAGALGLPALPPPISDAIAHAIACYKATAGGSPDTTVGNTLAEIKELKKGGRAYDRAVSRLANDRSGVDYVTLGMLQGLAIAALTGKPGAQQRLSEAADLRAAELRQHPRIRTDKEPLRLFGYVLRQIFNASAAPNLMLPIDNGWRHCRRFAMEVLTVAGIETAEFEAHPERLTEYLGTDL